VITGTATASLTESNIAQSTGGTLTVTDVDSSQTLIAQTNVAGNNGYGKFTVGTNGVWTYTMDNAHNEFAAGTNYTDSITVTSADGTASQVITVTIAGTNDAAVISGTATGSVTEASGVANGTAGTPTATGTLTSTDVDGTANSFMVVPSSSATYGSYTMTAGGVWTYTLNNNNATVQALNTGGTLTDTFTVTAADGTTQAISVTINGGNDAAVISGTATGSVTEASGAANATPGTPTATGTLTDTDVDNAANTFTAVGTATNSIGGYGTYTMTAGGVWTYTLNNNNATVQALNTSGTLTDTFTVTAVDGTAKTVTVTISGANDNAVITGTATASLTESNVAQSTGGTLTVTDVDSSQTLIAQTNVAGNNGYGKFTVGTNGVWTYTMDNAHNEFAAGTNYTDSITVTSADGTASQVITVTIAGTNDAAILSSANVNLVETNAALSTGGTLTISDADSPATFVAQSNVAGSYGSFSITSGGVWSYVANSAFDNLNVGDTNTETFTVAAIDGTTSSVTVNIIGTNDSPVLSAGGTLNYTENQVSTAIDAGLTITDIDSANITAATVKITANFAFGQDVLGFVNQNGITGSYNATTGELTLSGSATVAQYQAALRSVTYSNTSENPSSASRTISYQVNDGSAGNNMSNVGTAMINITAVNDAPVAIDDTVTVAEDTPFSSIVSLISNDTDVDGPIKTAVAGSYSTAQGGTLVLAADGSYTYTPALNFNGTDTVNYTVTDGTLTDVGTLTLTVTAVNDLPTGTDNTITINEDTSRTFAVSDFGFSDVDAGATLSSVRIDTLPAAGTLTLSGIPVTAGQVITAANIANLVFTPALNANGAAYANFTFSVNDGAGFDTIPNTISINVTPDNDAPVVANGSSSGLEDAVSIPVVLTATDVDGTIASFNLSSLPANGALYLDAAMTILATVGVDIAATGNSVTLYFKPQAEFNSTFGGTPSFDYTAKDDQGLVSSSATQAITVAAVDDGMPNAVNDSFQTVVGTAITFTRAQLLANDDLFDNAIITAVDPLPAGLTYNAMTQTYTYNPAAVGSASFTYTITDDDGQTDFAIVNLAAYDAAADLAVVNESALPDGSGGGVSVVSGNLLANDAGNTSVTSVSGAGAAVGGVFTVTTAYGVLQVTAASGAYTYTLNDRVDNDSQAGADTNGYLENFTYTGNNTGATLIDISVNIVDDAPLANDQIVEVAAGTLPNTNLVFVVDISGSMAGEVKSVDANGTVTIMTRLDAAKLALKGVINEYFSQGGNVSVKLVQFEATATLLNGGNAYATKEAAFLAIDGLALAGGTNYQDALLKTLTALGTVNTAENNTVYFISDGVPTSGDTTDPAASTGYRNFVNANGVKSYALGIASDISNPTELNNIHNVDADVSGTKDAAIIVTDVGRLDEVLLATVPTTFGGSVTGTAGVSSLTLGADGGSISSLIMKLDTNADNIPDTDVTFNFNGAQITVVGAFPASGFPLAGDLLTLNAANGFAKGILIFNFSTGEYSYQTGSMASAGDEFDIKFIATDLDGDTASGKQTIRVVDGKPEAKNDVDTLSGGETFLEGNVITATGTDDGNNLQLTTFNSGRSGEDNAVDNAQVSSIVFKGVTFDLTTTGIGSAAGGTYTVAAVSGVNTLTWTATTGGASLVFNADGYYKYIPPTADVDTTLAQPAITYDLTSAGGVSAAAAAGMMLAGIARTSSVEGSAAINTPNADGVGIVGNTNTRIDSLESLVINFDAALHPHGVQDVTIFVDTGNSNLGGTDAFNYSIYNIHGDLIGQFASNQEGAVNMPAIYTNIGKIIVDAGGVGSYAGSYGSVSSVTYASVADIDDVIPPMISIDDVLVDESAGTVTLTVSLNHTSTQTVTVDYATANGTATSGSDYTAQTGTLTFAPGTTTQTITVAILDNNDNNTALENFVLNLSNPANASIADNQGTVIIGDDDTSGRTALLISSPVVTEGGLAVFNVNFTRNLSSASVYTLAAIAGTATGGGTDYSGTIEYSTNGGTSWTNGTSVSLATGSTGFMVRVATVDDAAIENDETFSITVTRNSGNRITGSAGGVATIQDNDTPPPPTATVTTGVAPEIITYTLTDSQGDTSSAQLRLNVITDDIAGTSGNNAIVGTDRNEYISGLDGNDTIDGGAGYDIIKGGAGDDTIDGGADDDQLYGGDGLDTISGGIGKDEIYGDAGNDLLSGDAGDDKLYGGDGNDTVTGGDGADLISGGAGNDILTGGLGADTFKWELADAGVKGSPTADVITDFNDALPASGGDVLDLRDLLSGENHVTGAGNLASYLHFEKVVVGPDTNTVIHVSSQGEFAAGFNSAKEVQTITLLGVDLVGTNTNDQLIIQDMLNKGKLITD
jgi:VCBS repeat-containing protein